MSRIIIILIFALFFLNGCHSVFPFPSGSIQGDTASESDVLDAGARRDEKVEAPPDSVSDLPDFGHLETMPFDAEPADAVVDFPGSWVQIPEGSFFMGSPVDEPCRATNLSTPYETRHLVHLTRKFEISITEVTQGEFQALMGYNPSYNNCGPDCPVEQVSWHEAAAYCNVLSQLKSYGQCYTDQGSGQPCDMIEPCVVPEVCIQGKCRQYIAASEYLAPGLTIYNCPGFRLLTEAEWEYAYRAGTQTPYYNGDSVAALCTQCSSDSMASEIGWHCGNSSNTIHSVGLLPSNNWGLLDMAGNVYEWCHDYYQQNLGAAEVTDPVPGVESLSRIYRGGAYSSQPRMSRAAHRTGNVTWTKDIKVGFRCGRTIL